MKPAFAYYDGKTRLAPWICSLMPQHSTYVEPFAGSAAVLFNKQPCRHEVINDIDGNVINFFEVLRTKPDDLETACRLTPYARDSYTAAMAANLEDLDPIERARVWWVRSTQSFGQSGGPNTGWSISIAQSTNRPRQLQYRLGRFADAAERLLPVFIEHGDALDVIDRYGRPGALIYLDPPYLDATRTAYAGGRRPRGEYAHEFSSEAQHRALADRARSTPATVLLSGYSSPLYDDLYGDWWRAERQVAKNANQGQYKRRGSATEVIWSNRPLDERLLA